MDKAVANTLLDAARRPAAPGPGPAAPSARTLTRWKRAVSQTLGYPIFVKPANAGSSVGISKAADKAGFQTAVATALAETIRWSSSAL